MFELKIVDFVYDLNDRTSEIAKIINIFESSSYCNISEVRTFIDVRVYYQI